MEHRDLIDKLLHSQKWEQTQGLIVQTIHSYLEELASAGQIPGCPMPIWRSCWNSIPSE